MKRLLFTILSLPTFFLTSLAIAEPEYATIEMGIDIEKPANEVWAKVGADYCAISEWLSVDCEIASGEGGVGTVRLLAGGRVNEILIAQTELSYGYTQPIEEGSFYNLYHGFMEARPLAEGRTRLLYTLVYDVSELADQAAKDEDVERRRTMFETALMKMKGIAEGK